LRSFANIFALFALLSIAKCAEVRREEGKALYNCHHSETIGKPGKGGILVEEGIRSIEPRHGRYSGDLLFVAVVKIFQRQLLIGFK
jgi:hypothetical protein